MDDLHSTLVAVHRCCLPWLQALLTLSHKYFALFNRSTCALSVLCHYSGLQGIHLATSSCSQKQPYSWKGSTTRLTTLLNRQVYRDCHPRCMQFQAFQIYPAPCKLWSSNLPNPTGQAWTSRVLNCRDTLQVEPASGIALMLGLFNRLY